MKIYVPLLLIMSILFCSCQFYFGKRIYKRIEKKPIRNNQIRTKGYYYYEDSTYHKYNYKQEKYNGAFYPKDSIKIIYYNFIVLKNDGTGYVNLSTNWDGLEHMEFDSQNPPKGDNSKEVAHKQFLEWAKTNKIFNDKNKKNSFPALYEVKNDSISINYFEYVIDGKYTLCELKGSILDNNTFQIMKKKVYKTFMVSKEKEYKISMVFNFEEF